MTDKTKNILIVTLLLILLFIGGLLTNNVLNQNKYKQLTNQNIAALQDSVRVLKDENGKLEFAKASYSMELSELEKTNITLANELKINKNKVATLVSTNITLKEEIDEKDATIASNQKERDDLKTKMDELGNLTKPNEIDWNWDYTKEGLEFKLKGLNTFLVQTKDKNIFIKNYENKITEIETKLNLMVGVRYNEDLKVWEAYSKSTYQNLKIDIESYIDQDIFFKSTKNSDVWVVSLYGGYGINSSNSLNTLEFGPSIGISVGYILFTF